MNVLGILPQYPPWSRVGSWLTTHDYLAGMVARGHTVDVVCLQMREEPYELDGVNVYPNGSEVPRPDVVVSHLGDRGHGANFAAKFDVPSIRFVHGHAPDNAILLDQGRTDIAIFSSQALADDTGWDGPQIVAHPPIFPDRYTTEPGTKVTLSNLSSDKGGLLLGWIADAHRDVEFLGVRGWGRQMLQQPPNVEIIPPSVDVRDIYAQTRILLMPSIRESYGRVGIEAACSGIPTIAHPSPGLVEALGDHATWVDRYDRQGWFDAVGELGDPDAWKTASREARRAVQSDPDATVDGVCDALEGKRCFVRV